MHKNLMKYFKIVKKCIIQFYYQRICYMNQIIFVTEDFSNYYAAIESFCPIVTLEFHHRDSQWLAGGLMNGQVAFWDIRQGSSNVAISDIRKGHRDSVNSIRWTQSKTGTEFFSGSRDSQVI